MLKKLPIVLICALAGMTSYAQTIVSTTPENRKVVLEEFTGIHCVYCPEGHAIAQGLKDANPDNVFLINVHTGMYSTPGNNEPDFRTAYGSALAAQSGLTGFPAATVNRQNFPGREMGTGGTTALGRNYWAYAAGQVLDLSSYVNLAVSSNIDASTNVMTIHVEGYYTGDSPESTNLLNVAILQNNTKGPQTGGNMGNNYNHVHRLIDMVTGQWGEEITTTSSGTFFERDYTYEIIPHNNYVPVEIAELEVVVFLSETHQMIVSGNGTVPTISITNTNDANVRYIEPVSPACLGSDITVSPKVNIQNAGSNPITSLEITYNINETPSGNTYTWTGNLEPLASTTIALPEVTMTALETNTIEISVPNDDHNESNFKDVSFEAAPSGAGKVNMVLKTDAYGTECRWDLKDSSGNIISSGGPYGSRQTVREQFLLEEDCYTFTIKDTYRDGGTTVTLTDDDGLIVYHTDGDFGTRESGMFSSNGVLGVNEAALENISIYPNPTQNILNISNAETSDIQVFDMLGRMILSKENISLHEQLNVSMLTVGTYFIKISKEGNTTTKKFIVAE